MQFGVVRCGASGRLKLEGPCGGAPSLARSLVRVDADELEILLT
jgi:hypothetical protein